MSPLSLVVLALYAWLLSDYSLSSHAPYNLKEDAKVVTATCVILSGFVCITSLVFQIDVLSLPFFLLLMGSITCLYLCFFALRPYLDKLVDMAIERGKHYSFAK